MTTVKIGSSGTDVKILQACLRMLQYTGADGKPIEVDGYAGQNTIAAVNKFQMAQEAYGYPCGNGDGSFGSKCWQRLLGM